MVISSPNLRGMRMIIKGSNLVVSQATNSEYKADLLEKESENEVYQAKVSLIAQIRLKSVKERLEWSETASSGGRNLFVESFNSEFSITQDSSAVLYSRSQSLSELSAGNQWLETRCLDTEKTPLILFLERVGFLGAGGKVRSDKSHLDRNANLAAALNLLENLLDQEKKTCGLEETFTYDDLPNLEIQMQSFSYKKLSYFLSKSTKPEGITKTLKAIIESAGSEAEKIMRCKDVLKGLSDHLFSRILNSLFSNPASIEMKAKEMVFEGNQLIDATDLKWDLKVSISSQWSKARAFEEEIKFLYSKFQEKLKPFGIQNFEDFTSVDIDPKNFDEVRGLLEEGGSLSLTSAPNGTRYESFSRSYDELEMKYQDILRTSSDPFCHRLAGLAFLSNKASALNELSTKVEGEVARFVSKYLGTSEGSYLEYLNLWEIERKNLSNEQGSPFWLFLKSRDFFESKSQKMRLDSKLGRFVAYQTLFHILTSVAAHQFGMPLDTKQGNLAGISDFARRVGLSYVVKDLSRSKYPIGPDILAQICRIHDDPNMPVKEKILQVQGLISEADHPATESFLWTLEGRFISETSELDPVIKGTFSLKGDIGGNPFIQTFIKEMGIQDRRASSYDENYFEKVEAFVKFKRYLLAQKSFDPAFIDQLKQIKDYEVEKFGSLLSEQPKAEDWMREMLEQINMDVKWFKEKAITYGLQEVAAVLSKNLTGYQGMIALNRCFYLLQRKLTQEIRRKELPSNLERCVEESCWHQNTKALDHLIQKIRTP
jgi:hypothetical protein